MTERAEDIMKLSLAYAHKHKRAEKLFESFEDYVQELRLFVLEKLDKYDSDKGEFSTFCYLCFVTRVRYQVRHFKKQLKTVSMEEIIEDDTMLKIKDVIPDPNCVSEDDILSDIDNKAQVKKFINCLSDETLMHFYFNMNHTEIAQLTQRTHQNVSSKISKDLHRVKEMLNSGKLVIRRDNCKRAEEYAKAHHCSVRTYYRRKKENTL